MEHPARIASAFDWRKDAGRPSQERADTDTELYDRHGVPRCQHCGGPGDITAAGLGLKFDRNQDPYLAFRCMLGHTTECARTQSIQCSENWTLLVPLSRTTEDYHQLAHGRKPGGRTHHHARQRYAVAGKGTAGKLKRKGLAAQQLRCDASLIIEWFRILIRQGWLDGEQALNPSESVLCSGGDRLAAMRHSRMKYGLNLPCGPAALRLDLARTAAPPRRDSLQDLQDAEDARVAAGFPPNAHLGEGDPAYGTDEITDPAEIAREVENLSYRATG